MCGGGGGGGGGGEGGRGSWSQFLSVRNSGGVWLSVDTGSVWE